MLNAETKRHIDAARDVLVGVAPNPMTQIDQITYALIYKFMDDMDQAAIKAGGDPSFFTGDLEPYGWSKLVDSRMGNQEKMNLYGEALQKFAEAKQLPELFRTIFRSAFLPYRSPETLGLFLKEISFFDYTHPEELGNAYEYLLSIMSAQGDAGQFRTPRHIIDFIVDVINPTKDDTVLDPACGTGGFLISSYNHILEQHQGKSDSSKQEKPLTPDERKKLMSSLEGYDIDPSMVRIAQVNMYLHQFKNPKIFQYDSLTSEERWNDKFDVILANPPFMSPKGGIKPHNKFALQSNRSEVLFVDYIVNHLKPSGRAGIIVPEGVIFQSGKAYRQLRKQLVEGGLYAVVSLPSGVFSPYSGVKTSILLINSEVARNRDEILFVKITADGYDLGATKRPLDKNDLPEAKRLIDSWSVSGFVDSHLAFAISKSKIRDNPEYGLSGDRYADKVERELASFEYVKLEEVVEYEQPTKYLVATENYDSSYPTPVLTAGKTFILGYTDENEGIYDGPLPVIIFDDFTTASRLVNFRFKVKSSAMKFLHVDRSKALPAFIYHMMQHIDFPFTEHKRYWISEYSKLEIPLPSLEVQRRIVGELDGFESIIDGAKRIVENWKPRIDVDPDWQFTTLGEVATISAGNSAPQGEEHYLNGVHPFFRTSDVGSVHLSNNLTHTRDKLTKKGASGMKLYPKRTILFPKSGASTFLNHRVLTGVEGYVSSHLATILTDSSRLLPEFAYYFLTKIDARTLTADQSYPSLRLRDIENILIPLPPVDAQIQIVGELLEEESAVLAANKLAIDCEKRIKKLVNDLWNE